MARLALTLMGPPQVTLEGRPVAGFDSDKVRALLIYLAMEGERPHRRQALAGLLWPERPERDARRSLRQCLYSLRRTIGDHDAVPPYLLIDGDAIQMNPVGDCWVDATAFGELMAAGDDAQVDADALGEAMALYVGPFLEGFSLGDAPEFEEWCGRTRERLGRLACDALERLSGLPERWANDFDEKRGQEALDTLAPEIDNARRAWDWAVEHGRGELVDRSAETLTSFYERSSRQNEGAEAVWAAAERLREGQALLARFPQSKYRGARDVSRGKRDRWWGVLRRTQAGRTGHGRIRSRQLFSGARALQTPSGGGPASWTEASRGRDPVLPVRSSLGRRRVRGGLPALLQGSGHES